MKYFLVLMFTVSMFSFPAIASTVESNTDCLMMKEENERTNPKANLGSVKPKAPKGKTSVSGQ